MTRRERLERKLEQRREWALGRKQKAAARLDNAMKIIEHIPPGQPILIGHHSEKRHRADLARHDANMRAGLESLDMAKHHESKAEGIADQLESSIFSDDDNAIEALEARIAEREARRQRIKAINAAIRKGEGWESRLNPPLTDDERKELVTCAKFSFRPHPDNPDYLPGYPPYVLQNLGGNIRSDKERIAHIKIRQRRTEQAEANGGVLVKVSGEWATVTFAEKPEREILNALKAAGFRWGAGSWSGYAAKLPECVKGGAA